MGKLKNPILDSNLAQRAVKGTVDGILNVCLRIAAEYNLTTFSEVYEFILNLSPTEFAALQIKKSSDVDIVYVSDLDGGCDGLTD